MLPEQIDRIFDLAREHQKLARLERSLIVRMAHIYQRVYKPNDIAVLIPKRDRKAFLTNIAPALNHKSLCYRTRALALTYRLMGVLTCSPTITSSVNSPVGAQEKRQAYHPDTFPADRIGGTP